MNDDRSPAAAQATTPATARATVPAAVRGVDTRQRLCRAVRERARALRIAVASGQEPPLLAVLTLRAFADGLVAGGERDEGRVPGLADAHAVTDAVCDALCPGWRRHVFADSPFVGMGEITAGAASAAMARVA